MFRATKTKSYGILNFYFYISGKHTNASFRSIALVRVVCEGPVLLSTLIRSLIGQKTLTNLGSCEYTFIHVS